MTPRAFVDHCRVEHAKHLLARSNESIASIAVEVGLGTQGRLTTTFKRQTGFTLAIYRRRRH